MPTFKDLQKMSYAELSELRENVEKAMVEAKTKDRAKAIVEAAKVATSFGFSLEELVEKTKSPKKKMTLAPKYRKPDDASVTWSGHGRRPRWVVEHLDGGGSLEDLAV